MLGVGFCTSLQKHVGVCRVLIGFPLGLRVQASGLTAVYLDAHHFGSG